MNNITNYLWVEKYRPSTLDRMVLPDDHRKMFDKYIQEKEIPTLLFFGPQGSGKTSIARILIDSIITDRADKLIINGSSSTGIDIVRDHIEEFLKTPTFGNSKIKIVFIDEFEYMSLSAQACLRNTIETFHRHGRFIFTCNYISKVIKEIQSRCQQFEFNKLPKEYMLNYCKNILDTEKISYDDISIKRAILTFYPDLRRIVNILQSKCENGQLQISGKDLESNEKSFKEFFTGLISGINSGNNVEVNNSIQNIQQLLAKTELDYISLYQDLFNNGQNIPIWAKIIINKYGNNHMGALIPAMHLMSMIYEILEIGKKLKGLQR